MKQAANQCEERDQQSRLTIPLAEVALKREVLGGVVVGRNYAPPPVTYNMRNFCMSFIYDQNEGESRNYQKALVGSLERKRYVGRPRSKRNGTIKMYEKRNVFSGCELDSYGSGYSPMAVSYEERNEPLFFIIDQRFHTQPNDCQLFKTDSGPCSYTYGSLCVSYIVVSAS